MKSDWPLELCVASAVVALASVVELEDELPISACTAAAALFAPSLSPDSIEESNDPTALPNSPLPLLLASDDGGGGGGGADMPKPDDISMDRKLLRAELEVSTCELTPEFPVAVSLEFCAPMLLEDVDSTRSCRRCCKAKVL